MIFAERSSYQKKLKVYQSNKKFQKVMPFLFKKQIKSMAFTERSKLPQMRSTKK